MSITFKTIKYTIETSGRLYGFDTLKQARQYAQYLGGMVIIKKVNK
jgi:hypothetical protein